MLVILSVAKDLCRCGRQRALTEAVEAERAQDLKAARRALTQAVKVYQGDVLPSCYDEWLIPERDRLRQAFLRALERLIELLEHERDYATAISMAQRLLRLDPLHEATGPAPYAPTTPAPRS